MLSCIYNNEDFNNKQEGYSEKMIRALGLSKQLLCPRCGRPVFFCAEGKITSHFKHFDYSCEDKHLYKYDINSERHHKSVDFFYNWIHNQYPNIKIVKDKYLKFCDIEQKADLYLELENSKVAFEIQFKHINFDELEEKRRFYKNLNIKDIWIFVKNSMFSPGTPYERHYYRSNNNELYFFYEYSKRFIYYKGLKKEKFEEGNLMSYITYESKLDEVKLNSFGKLDLPLWKKMYIEKLYEKRESHKQKIKNKLFNSRYTVFFKEIEFLNSSKDNSENYSKRSLKSKQLFDYKEINFINHNNIEYVEIIYIYNGETKVLYKVKNKSGSGNEIFMICEKPGKKSIFDLNINTLIKKVTVKKWT